MPTSLVRLVALIALVVALTSCSCPLGGVCALPQTPLERAQAEPTLAPYPAP